jgi:hypothetical protein
MMKNSWQPGQNPFMFRMGAKPPGLFGLLLIAVGLLFFIVFGVGILMLAATLAVLLLPWLWWKRRQLMQKMAAARSQYEQQQASPSSQSGVVIEGEVIRPVKQPD